MKLNIGFVSLFVTDLPGMLAFYRDVVGLEVLRDGDAYVEFVNEGVRFAMFRRDLLAGLLRREVQFPREGLNGSFELALPVGAKENVDAAYERLVSQGATPVYAPRDEPWQMRSAMIADPEGNLIEIASDFWE